jgi:hypothetical protein
MRGKVTKTPSGLWTNFARISMGYGRASRDRVLAELRLYSIPFFRVSHIELIISLHYLVLGKRFL